MGTGSGRKRDASGAGPGFLPLAARRGASRKERSRAEALRVCVARAHLPGKERRGRGPGPSRGWSAGRRRRRARCCWLSPPAWRRPVAKVSARRPELRAERLTSPPRQGRVRRRVEGSAARQGPGQGGSAGAAPPGALKLPGERERPSFVRPGTKQPQT